MPRAILAYFNRWSWYIWSEGSTQASDHTWRENLATPNQVLNLCKIIGVKRDNCVKCWFWLHFKDNFSLLSSNFHSLTGSLGTGLWILDSYLRDLFLNPQVFYALLPCVVQNSNNSFWHVENKETSSFLFPHMLYCIFLCFEREYLKIISFTTHAPGHQLKSLQVSWKELMTFASEIKNGDDCLESWICAAFLMPTENPLSWLSKMVYF